MKNDKDYWFPAKTFGWGWGLPVRWQGWVVMVSYILFLLLGIRHFQGRPHSEGKVQLYIFGLTAILIVVAYIKGEKPQWRWGNK